jgi:microcystin-dependent protein
MTIIPGGTISVDDFRGLIMMWAGAAAPDGWLICDGQAISRVTHADLFAIIGTTYGAGDGSTTFNLPNLKGRVPVGLDGAQAEFNALAKEGGAKTHTLTTSEIPSHRHYLRREANATGAYAYRPAADSNVRDGSSGDSAYTANEGGGGSHNNLQPYVVVNFIIKT